MEGAPEKQPALSLPVITVWAPQDGPRLRYVLDWLIAGQLGCTYTLTADEKEAEAAKHCIAIGFLRDKVSIHDSGLLFETGIRLQGVVGKAWSGLHTYFYQEASPCTIPFDLLSGVFYFLTRYEEYLDGAKDKHGRYPSANSILSKEGVLERPILDEWVHWLRNFLSRAWSIEFPRKPFAFAPTYDIDIAWAYKHKGAKRTLGAAFGDILTGRAHSFFQRINVLAGNAHDPYDAFEWMRSLHRKYKLPVHYFILAAARSSPFDKNIPLRHPAMRQLVRALCEEGPVGIHPSYFTRDNAEKLLAEKRDLEEITGGVITISRQHYIRLFLPATYRALIAVGITDDYSMGYGTAPGFRAGTSLSFYWYDLEKEIQTDLRIHPFCFMDTTAHFDLGLSAEAAFLRLRQMQEKLIACGGTLTTIFHNFSLGSDVQWAGWKAGYAALIENLSAQEFV